MSKRKSCLNCTENARERHDGHCDDYQAQVTWNRKMARILSTEPTWRTETFPEPDYTDHWATGPVGVAGRYPRSKHIDWTRKVYALLAQDGAPYRRLRAALARARKAV